jgi:phosphonatase-like hydrolase
MVTITNKEICDLKSVVTAVQAGIICTMKQVRLVVFDIMGTIIEDRGQVADSFAVALSRRGFSVPAEEIKEIKGAAKREAIRNLISRQQGGSQGIDEVLVDLVYGDFRALLEAKCSNGGAAPITGVSESLNWLNERGIAAAATTGFYRKVTDLLISAVGWSNRFSAIVCSEDVAYGRPAPYMIFRCMELLRIHSVHEVINVGDTPLDIQAGNNAGVGASVGVLTGVHARSRLAMENPSALIASVAELPRFIQQHIRS